MQVDYLRQLTQPAAGSELLFDAIFERLFDPSLPADLLTGSLMYLSTVSVPRRQDDVAHIEDVRTGLLSVDRRQGDTPLAAANLVNLAEHRSTSIRKVCPG